MTLTATCVHYCKRAVGELKVTYWPFRAILCKESAPVDIGNVPNGKVLWLRLGDACRNILFAPRIVRSQRVNHAYARKYSPKGSHWCGVLGVETCSSPTSIRIRVRLVMSVSSIYSLVKRPRHLIPSIVNALKHWQGRGGGARLRER